jgi:hypothetical protein
LASLPRVATVSDRYLSYNIEMVEVTGGRFWAPYGFGNDRYRMRPAVNLADPSLLAFARQLGPTYLRVSGTWANTTYLPAKDETVTTPPEGYNQVLSRRASSPAFPPVPAREMPMAAGIPSKRSALSISPAKLAAASMARNCSTSQPFPPTAVFPRITLQPTIPAISAFSARGRRSLHLI